MNNAKHTPGPWIVHTFTISGKEKLEVLDATGTNACVQANAHLIAAAPAMYEALKALVDVFPSVVRTTPYGVSMDISKLHDNAKAALQQAEGR